MCISRNSLSLKEVILTISGSLSARRISDEEVMLSIARYASNLDRSGVVDDMRFRKSHVFPKTPVPACCAHPFIL